ncbi:MAG: tetratricopeptide repeat protein, partial [Thermodesulfobacteriota bacterium]
MRQSKTRTRLLTALVCLFLVLPALWIYHPIRHHETTNCDDYYITENAFKEKFGLNLETLVYGATVVTTGVWMPFTELFIGIEHVLFGTDYGMYRMGCLLLHVANGLLLFFTLRLMTGAFWKSALVAALFVLHPLNVEPVAWLVGIRVVLCSFLALASLFLYALHVRRESTWSYTLALVCFMISITSVPMYVTLPCVLLLTDYWPLERFPLLTSPSPEVGRAAFNWKAAGWLAWEKMPFFLGILGMSAVVLVSHELPFVHHHPLTQRLLNIPLAYVQYLARFFCPTGLSVFYPLPAVFSTWKVAGAVLLLLAITAAALRTAVTHRFFIVGWLWFAGMMVPLSGVVQIGTQAMADHYTYLPMIGLLAAVIWGWESLLGRWKAAPVVSAAAAATVLFVFMVLSARQVGVWKNSFTLLEHALAVTENNYEAHNHLGQAFAEKGDREKAVFHFSRALAIRPDHVKSHHNLATVYMQAGNLEKAGSHFEQALRTDPSNIQSLNSLGLVLAAQGRLAEAFDRYRQALAIAPRYFQALNNLATALAAAGRLEEAEVRYRQALDIEPGATPVLFNLADVLSAQGKDAEAVRYLRQALDLAPDLAKARLKLADILTAMGNPGEAAAHYEILAGRLPGSADLHYLAGRAFHDAGDPAAAARHLERALRIDPSMKTAKDLLETITTRPAPAGD